MSKEETIKNLKKLKSFHNGSYGTAIDEAIKALEQISHLTDRPCSVCEFHKEDGCSKWECVFEGSDSDDE
jgi:hypothetical protein